MAALIAVVILVAVVLLGSNLGGLFGGSANALGNPPAAGAPGTDPCATATASGTPLPTCDTLTGAWSCPTGYTLTFASPEYTCTAAPAAPTPYSGPTPNSSYSYNIGNNGSYSLPSIPGIQYSLGACSNQENGGCGKVSLASSALTVNNGWGNSEATQTVAWSIPANGTTGPASGFFTVRLT